MESREGATGQASSSGLRDETLQNLAESSCHLPRVKMFAATISRSSHDLIVEEKRQRYPGALRRLAKAPAFLIGELLFQILSGL